MPTVATLPARLVHALVADPRSVRAIDETLLDIRTEYFEAAVAGARMLWAVRSTDALVRVLMCVFVWEIRASESWSWCARLCLWSVGLGIAVTITDPGRDPDTAWVPLVFIAQWLRTLFLGFVMASFWASLWPPRRRHSSPLVRAIVAGLLVWVVMFCTPLANAFHQRQLSIARYGESNRSMEDLRKQAPMTLLRQAVASPATPSERLESQLARRVLSDATALAVVSGLLVILGVVISNRFTLRWPWALAGPAFVFGPVFLVGGPFGLWVSAGVIVAVILDLALLTAPLER